MRAPTIADYLNMFMTQNDGAQIAATARRWLDIDRSFKRWLHDSARKQVSDEVMYSLGEAEESLEHRSLVACQAFSRTRAATDEAALAFALQATIAFREQQMARTLE